MNTINPVQARKRLFIGRNFIKMAITRAKKEEIIKGLHEKAEKSKTAVFLNFHNLSALDMTHLRRELRNAGADFKVAKKTLIKRVLNAFGYSGEMPKLDGEVAIAFGYEESPETAKIAKKFMKDHKGLSIIGGIFGGKYVLADFVERLASLPDLHTRPVRSGLPTLRSGDDATVRHPGTRA